MLKFEAFVLKLGPIQTPSLNPPNFNMVFLSRPLQASRATVLKI
jgi:hypothetical protein